MCLYLFTDGMIIMIIAPIMCVWEEIYAEEKLEIG
jgi:hypothetical protein